MPTQAVFPIPIYYEQSIDEEYENIQSELYKIFNLVRFTNNNDNNHDLSLDRDDKSFSDNQIVKYKCNNLINFIHHSMVDYFKSLNISDNLQINHDYIIKNSWFTKTNKGQKAPLHYHGDADISGVYYLQTNGNDGNLNYHSPHRGLESSFIYSKIEHSLPMLLNQGLLALWPGNVWHDTLVNLTDHERISVSFNIQVSRKGFKVDPDQSY
tara:strand:+ start:217 stop:849 length:633 start_codon:yes stop_codon:yes gene_type:complete